MLLLYTDFGHHGPYVGQMHAVLAQRASAEIVIDLMHDAPRFKPRAAGRLLTALAPYFPPQSICLAVIDPGVGGPRRAVAVEAGGHWFVGPDNGLFDGMSHRFEHPRWHEIRWRPENLSASFHGRDLFAPIAAALAAGEAEDMLTPVEAPAPAPAELPEVIYIDHYGNAMTGLSADTLRPDQILEINGHHLSGGRTFSSQAAGTAFWYANSVGLIEIAVNQGNASQMLKLHLGDAVTLPSLPVQER